MSEWEYIFALVAVAVGYFCAGRLWERRSINSTPRKRR
jgi:hypothetical protein